MVYKINVAILFVNNYDYNVQYEIISKAINKRGTFWIVDSLKSRGLPTWPKTMFKEIVLNYKKFTEYSVYLLVLLIIMDNISTYVGITYFEAYEANRKSAYLFEVFGIILPSGLKLLTVILLGYVIKTIWKNSESLLSDKSGWMSSFAVLSSLNIMFTIISLNVVYFIIVINNINIIYRYL